MPSRQSTKNPAEMARGAEGNQGSVVIHPSRALSHAGDTQDRLDRLVEVEMSSDSGGTTRCLTQRPAGQPRPTHRHRPIPPDSHPPRCVLDFDRGNRRPGDDGIDVVPTARRCPPVGDSCPVPQDGSDVLFPTYAAPRPLDSRPRLVPEPGSARSKAEPDPRRLGLSKSEEDRTCDNRARHDAVPPPFPHEATRSVARSSVCGRHGGNVAQPCDGNGWSDLDAQAATRTCALDDAALTVPETPGIVQLYGV